MQSSRSLSLLRQEALIIKRPTIPCITLQYWGKLTAWRLYLIKYEMIAGCLASNIFHQSEFFVYSLLSTVQIHNATRSERALYYLTARWKHSVLQVNCALESMTYLIYLRANCFRHPARVCTMINLKIKWIQKKSPNHKFRFPTHRSNLCQNLSLSPSWGGEGGGVVAQNQGW